MSVAVVIPCGARKLDRRAPARELYTGSQFRLGLQAGEQLAQQLGAQLLIVSAMHGLVELETELEPYDLTMSDLAAVTVDELAAQLVERRVTQLHALTPRAYTDALAAAAERAGCQVVPYLAGTRGLLDQRRVLAMLKRGELVEAAP